MNQNDLIKILFVCMVTILSFSSCQDSLHIIDSNDNESVKKTICDIIYTLGFNGNNTHGYNSDFNGTSASCPQVAAIAALTLSVNSNLSNTQVADIIEQTARKTDSYIYTTNSDRPNGSWNMYMGYGLVDAAAAVKKAQSVLNK